MGLETDPVIALHAVCKAYVPNSYALDAVSLTVERGQFVALLGPSGCGKTTTLRLIAGLEQPDTGTIWLAGRQVAGDQIWVPPEARRIGMVFQDYALFPHLTVAENIAFARMRRPKAEQRQRVQALLDLVELNELGQRYPHQLSGGQQQRVALARALAADPTVVLLDEPFSNLDSALRIHMREQVQQIVEQAQATTVLVTHDQEEALSLADVVIVMFAGCVAQVGTPQQIYRTPVSKQVAEFVGEANWLSGEAHGHSALCSLGEIQLQHSVVGPIDLLIRPEAVQIIPDSAGVVSISKVRYVGHSQYVELRLPDGGYLGARGSPDADYMPGMQVNVRIVGPLMAYSV